MNVFNCDFCFQEGLSTLCFYNVGKGKETAGSDGSYYNEQEVFSASCFKLTIRSAPEMRQNNEFYRQC